MFNYTFNQYLFLVKFKIAKQNKIVIENTEEE